VKELSEPGMHHIVGLQNGHICCFASVLSCTEPDLNRKLIPVLYIYELHVLPSFQKLGLGKWLLEEVIGLRMTNWEGFTRCRRIMLTCQTANISALSFYTKHGFQPDQICPSRCLSKSEAAQIGYQILSKIIERL